MARLSLHAFLIAAATTLNLSLIPAAALADDAELRARLEKLSAEIEALKAELKQLDNKTEAIATQQEARPSASAPAQAQAVGLAAVAPGQTTLFGYGEINYNRPRRDAGETQADLRRAVIGIGHRFDERTRFVSEFEWEHAVTSAVDSGETAVEQFFVDHRLTDAASVKAGLFLVPSGLLNEVHEPPRYFGVERNFVETAIIPSTWREGGVAVYGTTGFGLTWDVGVTTGFDLGKWDATSTAGRESPLGSIHQELQFAKAKDLSTYVALNYRGVAGLALGGSLFTGKAGQGQAGFAAPDARVTLWEAHARWQPGDWDVSAVYAKGTISGTGALNPTFVAEPTKVPQEFFGWYAQAAYKLWQSGDYSATPFLRYERFNTASQYAQMPAGLGIEAAPTEGVWTYGLSFNLHPNVVLKTDYQKFQVDDARDRFNLGLGLMF